MPSGVCQVSFETSPPVSFSARARQSSSDFLGTSRSATDPRLLVPLWTPPVRIRRSAGLRERGLGVGVLRSGEGGAGLGDARPSDVAGAVVEPPVGPVGGAAAATGRLAPAAGPCRCVELHESKLRTHVCSIAPGYDRYSVRPTPRRRGSPLQR